MNRRQYISSLDVAAESLKQNRVVVESDRNRSKHVRATALRPRKEWYDEAFYLVSYGANGVKFTVAVYAHKSKDEPDGISVMHDGSDGKSETAHYRPMITDLPAEVRPVVRDVQAGLGFQDTRADKARNRKWDASRQKFDARMLANYPECAGPDGKLDREKLRAVLDRNAKIEEARNAEIAVATHLAQRTHEAECAATQHRLSWGEFTAIRATLDAHPMRHYGRAEFDSSHNCKGLSTCRYRAPAAVVEQTAVAS